MLSAENFLSIFNEYSSYAFFISLGLSIIIAVLGVVPSVFVTGANILFFGPLYGFLISLLGEVVGGVITFYLYRYGFKSKAMSIGDKYRFVNRIIESRGRRAFFLVLEARLIPFVPSGFVTLAAAISSMEIVGFILATLIGKIPSIALEALVSYQVINIEENFIKLVATLIGIGLIFITLKKKNY
ncbi:MAG: VTT domain-containing protein [Clostridium sp.]